MFLICGEALYDVFVGAGDDPASFPLRAQAGGSPFNVALGLARMEEPVGLLTGLSRDVLGTRLFSMLEREGVATDYLMRTDRPTTVVLVTLTDDGQPSYVFYGGDSADCGVTSAELPVLGPEISGIHFGSYSLVVEPVADAFASLLPDLGERFVSLDPNIRPTIEPDMGVWQARVQSYAEHADLVKISAEDIDLLYPGRTHEALAEALLGSGAKLVVVTDGGAPVRAWTQSGLRAEVAPLVSDVVDTVGAGDTFQAALIARLHQLGDPKSRVAALQQSDLDDLLAYAARAAAITCSRRGADLPRLSELG